MVLRLRQHNIGYTADGFCCDFNLFGIAIGWGPPSA